MQKAVSASSSASLLLDSLLCAVAPLIGLTEQVPELRSCTRHTLVRECRTHITLSPLHRFNTILFYFFKALHYGKHFLPDARVVSVDDPVASSLHIMVDVMS